MRLLLRRAFDIFIEPRERGWWLQMSFSTADGANSAPQMPHLDFRGHFDAGKEKTKKGKGGIKRKGRKSTG